MLAGIFTQLGQRIGQVAQRGGPIDQVVMRALHRPDDGRGTECSCQVDDGADKVTGGLALVSRYSCQAQPLLDPAGAGPDSGQREIIFIEQRSELLAIDGIDRWRKNLDSIETKLTGTAAAILEAIPEYERAPAGFFHEADCDG